MSESTGITPEKPQGWGSIALSLVAIVVIIAMVSFLTWLVTAVGYVLGVVLLVLFGVFGVISTIVFYGKGRYPGTIAGTLVALALMFTLLAGRGPWVKAIVAGSAGIIACIAVETLRPRARA